MTLRERTPSPLRIARERAGLTQMDLARAVGRHPATIGLAERGALSRDLARRVAEVLGCRVEDLLPPAAEAQP